MQAKKQSGSAGVIALIAVVIVVVLVGMTIGSWYNTAKNFEIDIRNAEKQSEIVLANEFYGKLDAANLGNQKYKDLMKTMLEGVRDGYQGASGGKAMALWLSNNVPQLDSSIAKSFIEIGEKGLTKFAASQTTLISIGQAYERWRTDWYRVLIVVKVMGFPSEDIAGRLKPVTDAQTDQSFQTKQRVSVSQPEQPAGK